MVFKLKESPLLLKSKLSLNVAKESLPLYLFDKNVKIMYYQLSPPYNVMLNSSI